MIYKEPSITDDSDSPTRFSGKDLADKLQPGDAKPLAVESWADVPLSKDLSDIPQLHVERDRYRYCSQGRMTIIEPDEQQQVGSDGFSKCSCLIVRDAESGRTMVAHAEPSAENIYYQLKEFTAQPADVTIIQGDQSVYVAGLDEFLHETGYVESAVRHIHVAGGQQSFGVLYDSKDNQVKVFERTPTRQVLTYQLTRS